MFIYQQKGHDSNTFLQEGRLKFLSQCQLQSINKFIWDWVIWRRFTFHQSKVLVQLYCLKDKAHSVLCTSTFSSFIPIEGQILLSFLFRFLSMHSSQLLWLQISTKKLILDRLLHRYHRNFDGLLEFPSKDKQSVRNFICDCFQL